MYCPEDSNMDLQGLSCNVLQGKMNDGINDEFGIWLLEKSFFFREVAELLLYIPVIRDISMT